MKINLRGQPRKKGSDLPNDINLWWKIPETGSEQEVISFIESRVGKARRRLYNWHGLWYLIAANFVGRQWATWSHETGIISDPVVDKKEILLTFNRIKPTVLREISALTIGEVPWTAVPPSGDAESVGSAEMDGKMLTGDWEMNNRRTVEDEVNFQRILYGTAGYYPHWDQTKGKMIRGGADPEWAGVADVDGISPFELRTDAAAKSQKDERWIAIEQMKDINWLEMAYNRGHHVRPEQPDPTEYLYYRIDNLSSHNFINITRADDTERFPHHASLKTYWQYPTRKYPRGREVHVAGNVVLFDDEWQNSWAFDSEVLIPPIILEYYIKLRDRYWGIGFVEDLLEPQWEYNKTRSQFTKIKNKMAKPKWVAAKEHGMPDAPDDEPGELIEYAHLPDAPSLKPEAITPSIPVGAFAEHWTVTMSDFQEIASQNDPTRGQNPPGVRSGKAIGLLQEADAMAKGHPMGNHFTALKILGYSIIGMYRHYGPEEMVIGMAGPNYEHTFNTWKKSKSLGGTRVMIMMDSGAPLTRSQRIELSGFLMETGLVDPVLHRAQMMRLINTGPVEDYFAEADVDIKVADAENTLMADGQGLPKPKREDNHAVHIERHDIWLKTHRDSDPEVVAVIRAHKGMHSYMQGMENAANAEMLADAEEGVQPEQGGMGAGLDSGAPAVQDQTGPEGPGPPPEGEAPPGGPEPQGPENPRP